MRPVQAVWARICGRQLFRGPSAGWGRTRPTRAVAGRRFRRPTGWRDRRAGRRIARELEVNRGEFQRYLFTGIQDCFRLGREETDLVIPGVDPQMAAER